MKRKKTEKKEEKKRKRKEKKSLYSSRTFLNFHLNRKSKCYVTDLNEPFLTSYLS